MSRTLTQMVRKERNAAKPSDLRKNAKKSKYFCLQNNIYVGEAAIVATRSVSVNPRQPRCSGPKFLPNARRTSAMETHTKTLSLPTWAEPLTARQRPERGRVLPPPRTTGDYDPARVSGWAGARTNLLGGTGFTGRSDLGPRPQRRAEWKRLGRFCSPVCNQRRVVCPQISDHAGLLAGRAAGAADLHGAGGKAGRPAAGQRATGVIDREEFWSLVHVPEQE